MENKIYPRPSYIVYTERSKIAPDVAAMLLGLSDEKMAKYIKNGAVFCRKNGTIEFDISDDGFSSMGFGYDFFPKVPIASVEVSTEMPGIARVDFMPDENCVVRYGASSVGDLPEYGSAWRFTVSGPDAAMGRKVTVFVKLGPEVSVVAL